MMNWVSRAAAGLLICAAIVTAQNTGSIGGTVADGTGAAVPGATVTLTNTATGEHREQLTSDQGYFTFTSLLPGTFSLRFSAKGFGAELIDRVELTVGQSRRVAAQLQPATVQTAVEVSGAVAPVVTTTASLSELVDRKRVEELPLNGRNVIQLIGLIPGTVSVGTSGQYGAVQTVFNVSGGRDVDMNFTLDGGIHMNPFYDIANEYPNPDALEEFSVSSRNYSAAFGRGSSSVNAVTKSGTNEFHGDVFEFVRNQVFDSRPFFAAQRSIFKRNQFGGVLGGPIRKDKLFFFGAYQGTRQVGNPGDSSYQTLTNQERTGDFSDQAKTIKDPTTNAPFPGNIIPPSRIDPFATNFIQQLLPTANSGANFYRFTPNTTLNQDQVTTKADYLLTSRDHFWFRYFYDNIPQVSGNFISAGFVANFPTTIRNYNLGYTRTIASNLVNELRATYVRAAYGVYPQKPWSLVSLGLNLPAANATSAFGLTSESAIAVTGYFSGNEGAPTRDIAPIIQVSDNLSWNHGIHQVTAGFDIYRNRLNEIQNYNTGGNITYSGATSGNAAADFELGRFSSLVQTSGFSARLRQTLPSLFLQDDIRATRRLTVNLGLRWDPFLPYTSENNTLATLVQGAQSTVFPNAPTGLLYPGDKGVPDNVIGNHWSNFAPRVGLAWDVRGDAKTSIRAGFGLYYLPLDRSTSLNRFGNIQPYSASVTISGGDTRNIFAAAPFNGVDPFIRSYSTDPAVLKTLAFLPTANETSFSRPFKTQSDRQYNFTIQQAIGKNSTVTVGYVGSSAEHLFTTFEENPAIYIPGQSTVANEQQRRPLPQIGSINAAASALSSNFNSLQATFNRHYSKGLTILSAWTWSKALGVAGAQKEGSNGPRDPNDWNLDYGPLPFDVSQTFKTSAIWDLPYSKTLPHALRMAAGGWQVGAILMAQSGLPFTVVSGVDNSLTGIGSDTANVVGQWQLPDGRSKAAQIQQWFNPKAFATNPIGTFGNAGIDILRAPGLVNLDLNVNKTFALAERKSLDVRGSFYNAFNHAALGAPNNKQNSSTFGQISTSGNPRVIELAMKFRF